MVQEFRIWHCPKGKTPLAPCMCAKAVSVIDLTVGRSHHFAASAVEIDSGHGFLRPPTPLDWLQSCSHSLKGADFAAACPHRPAFGVVSRPLGQAGANGTTLSAYEARCRI